MRSPSQATRVSSSPVIGGQAGEGVANRDSLIGRWGRFAEAMLEVGPEAVGKGVAAGLAAVVIVSLVLWLG